MGVKLKYVGSEVYPDYFVIPTYYEIVEVKNGIAEVNLEVTKERLLKEGFVLLEESEKVEVEEKPKEEEVKKKKKGVIDKTEKAEEIKET